METRRKLVKPLRNKILYIVMGILTRNNTTHKNNIKNSHATKSKKLNSLFAPYAGFI
jgi:hypothetical protein